MRVIGILGSPRKGGKSDLLLDKALYGASSMGSRVEKIVLNNLNIRPCQECGRCDKTGKCKEYDDMRLIYKKITAADVVIIASPVFFGSLTAQTKAMIDRFHCWWIRMNRLERRRPCRRKKKGIFLCVAGRRKSRFFKNAKEIIKAFFSVLGAEYFGELYCGGLDEKGSIKKYRRSLNRAFKLGASVVSS